MERKCIRCNINIIDNAVECPLCHGVLEIEHEAENSKDIRYRELKPLSVKLMKILKRVGLSRLHIRM